MITVLALAVAVAAAVAAALTVAVLRKQPWRVLLDVPCMAQWEAEAAR